MEKLRDNRFEELENKEQKEQHYPAASECGQRALRAAQLTLGFIC